MDFAPNEDHELIADAVRKRCADFDDSYWASCDEDHRFPWEFYAAMAEDGWVGMALPEQYGGGGKGITEAAILMREVAKSGAAMNGCSALHLTVFGLQPVVKYGNDRLRDTFLPRAAAGDLHVAFGVTEPDAGTDTSRISTPPCVGMTASGGSRVRRSGRQRRSRRRLCSSSCGRAPTRTTGSVD